MERSDFIDIMNLMANRSQSIHYVQILYRNGNFHNGFFSGIDSNYFPPQITFCDREVPKGTNPFHFIDWNNMETLVIKIYGEDNERVYHG